MAHKLSTVCFTFIALFLVPNKQNSIDAEEAHGDFSVPSAIYTAYAARGFDTHDTFYSADTAYGLDIYNTIYIAYAAYGLDIYITFYIGTIRQKAKVLCFLKYLQV